MNKNEEKFALHIFEGRNRTWTKVGVGGGLPGSKQKRKMCIEFGGSFVEKLRNTEAEIKLMKEEKRKE